MKPQDKKAPPPAVCARGPGFVIWVSSAARGGGGYMTWCQTAVAEFSPSIREAWRFPSLKSANDNLCQALGPRAEDCAAAIFPADFE